MSTSGILWLWQMHLHVQMENVRFAKSPLPLREDQMEHHILKFITGSAWRMTAKTHWKTYSRYVPTVIVKRILVERVQLPSTPSKLQQCPKLRLYIG
jgi:hypothetical protein